MLVVWWDSVPDAAAPLPPLQLVVRPANTAMEGGGKDNGLESGQMRRLADL